MTSDDSATMPALAQAAPVARLRGVVLTFGTTRALDGITVDIPAGRMVGLIGPDGVGKSSLLSLIAGARRIEEGGVEVIGGDMADASHRDAVCPRIAYMPQGLGKNLYPTLSVAENLEFFGLRTGQCRAQAQDSQSHAKHRPCFLSRSARGQALGRNEAEARPVLLPHSRS